MGDKSWEEGILFRQGQRVQESREGAIFFKHDDKKVISFSHRGLQE